MALRDTTDSRTVPVSTGQIQQERVIDHFTQLG